MCGKTVIRCFLPLFFLLILPDLSFAQNYGKYWVFFKDKSQVDFNPYEYFDPKAIERRIKHGLPLYDFTDLPVNEEYIAEVSQIADSTGYVTRWFNGMIVYGDAQKADAVKKLDFVLEVKPCQPVQLDFSALKESTEENLYEDLSEKHKALLANQVKHLGAHFFEKKNLSGKGVRIAVFDAGFPGVDEHPAFEHIRNGNRIIKTWDFVRNRENVYRSNSHGTMVLSCIAGKTTDHKIGLATDAEFLLARTEMVLFEPFSEEENWLAAAEWADKNGAHIINSSLGYTRHRYFVEEMDGQTSLVARAANMAATKGILVVNAAGNDGSGRWKRIGTPADADSVLSVGGIDPETDYHIGFSSFGPNARMKMKPNVAAYGEVIAANASRLTKTQGTSFASPLVAGFAACALESRPELKAMELFREIEKSANMYPYFDYAHGYGVPRAEYFTGDLEDTVPTFELLISPVAVAVTIKEEFMPEQKPEENDNMLGAIKPEQYIYERSPYLFYHIEKNGFVNRYYVLSVEQTEVLSLSPDLFRPGQTLRVHYRGYTLSHKF